MSRSKDIIKLPNALLQEVIFEVRWELDVLQESKTPFDKEYDLAKGVLKTLLNKDFQ